MPKTTEDYKKILAKLQEGGGGYGDKKYMTIEDGPNVVRILPGHPNMDGFYEEIMAHKKGNGASYMKVICVSHGDPNDDKCLIDPDIEALRQSDDKEDKKAYKEQMAKPVYFFNVIERTADHKDEEQKIIECGPMLLQEVLTLLTNEEYEDLLDPINGTDVTITKSGEKMKTEYKVTPRKKSGPILFVNGLADPDASVAFVGTDAKDTQITDLTDLKNQFSDEPEKAKLVWDKGWKALKDADDKKEDKAEEKPAVAAKPAPKLVKKLVAVATPAPQEDETPATTSFPKLKTRCSTCGESRYKTPSGPVCVNGHGGVPPLNEGERPSEPSKAYLKEFPEPVEEEAVEEEEGVIDEEEDEPIPVKTTKTAATPTTKKVATPVTDDEDDDGLEDLNAILAKHSTKGKK